MLDGPFDSPSLLRAKLLTAESRAKHAEQQLADVARNLVAADAILKSLVHPSNGLPDLRTCRECNEQYLDWMVSSFMKCHACRHKQQLAAVTAERDRALEFMDYLGAPEGLEAGIKWLQSRSDKYAGEGDRLRTQLNFANAGYEHLSEINREQWHKLTAATERAEKAEATLAAVRRHVEERQAWCKANLPELDLTEEIDHRREELAGVATVLDSGGAALLERVGELEAELQRERERADRAEGGEFGRR